jgi:hypothetical protein
VRRSARGDRKTLEVTYWCGQVAQDRLGRASAQTIYQELP